MNTPSPRTGFACSPSVKEPVCRAMFPEPAQWAAGNPLDAPRQASLKRCCYTSVRCERQGPERTERSGDVLAITSGFECERLRLTAVLCGLSA